MHRIFEGAISLVVAAMGPFPPLPSQQDHDCA